MVVTRFDIMRYLRLQEYKGFLPQELEDIFTFLPSNANFYQLAASSKHGRITSDKMIAEVDLIVLLNRYPTLRVSKILECDLTQNEAEFFGVPWDNCFVNM